MTTITYSTRVVQFVVENFLHPAMQQEPTGNMQKVFEDVKRKGENLSSLHQDDFQFGALCGYDHLVFDEVEDTFILDEVVLFLRDELSTKTHQKETKRHLALGWPTPSYTYRVGFVYGWLRAAIEQKRIRGIEPVCA